MTTGGASPSCFRYLQLEGNLPLPECRSNRIGQLRTIGSVGFVASATASPLEVVHHMNIMKIPVAVTELGVDGGIGKTKQIFFMAFKAKSIRPFRVRRVVGGGIRSRQQSEIIGAMGVVTSGASSLGDGAVNLCFSLQFIGDIFQRRQFVVSMTAETERLFVHGKEFFEV